MQCVCYSMLPQMIPNYVEGKTKESSSQFLQAQQLWKKSGTCPEGTVPIRRMLERDLLRSIPAQYPMEYHKKDPRSLVEVSTYLLSLQCYLYQKKKKKNCKEC